MVDLLLAERFCASFDEFYATQAACLGWNYKNKLLIIPFPFHCYSFFFILSKKKMKNLLWLIEKIIIQKRVVDTSESLFTYSFGLAVMTSIAAASKSYESPVSIVDNVCILKFFALDSFAYRTDNWRCSCRAGPHSTCGKRASLII